MRDYLLQLDSVDKLKNTKVRPIKVGDVVLVRDDNKRRLVWRIARVLNEHVGRDGLTRSYTIKFANGNLVKRPCQLLYPLEVAM